MLVFLHPCVLLNRLGGDGRSCFRGVVLLNVSCGSGDGPPRPARCGCDAYRTNRHDDKDLSHFSNIFVFF